MNKSSRHFKSRSRLYKHRNKRESLNQLRVSMNDNGKNSLFVRWGILASFIGGGLLLTFFPSKTFKSIGIILISLAATNIVVSFSIRRIGKVEHLDLSRRQIVRLFESYAQSLLFILAITINRYEIIFFWVSLKIATGWKGWFKVTENYNYILKRSIQNSRLHLGIFLSLFISLITYFILAYIWGFPLFQIPDTMPTINQIISQ